jgi:hypothetical protein
MLETGCVVDYKGRPIYWVEPPGRTAGSIPDTRDLWDVFRQESDRIHGFAHTHPGFGNPYPSFTAMESFRAIERGLGRSFEWWIVTFDCLALVLLDPVDRVEFVVRELDREGGFSSWLPELRRRSYEPIEKGKDNGSSDGWDAAPRSTSEYYVEQPKR